MPASGPRPAKINNPQRNDQANSNGGSRLRQADWQRQDQLRFADREREDAERSAERERTNELLEQNARAARMQQAASVAAWPAGRQRITVGNKTPRVVTGGTMINISNPSAQPIYDVLVFQVFIQGSGPRVGEDWMELHLAGQRFEAFKAVPLIPPGTWSVELPYVPPPPQGVAGVELAFTDRVGTHWVRRSNGDLQEIDEPAPESYGIDRPFPYAMYRPEYVDDK